MTLPWVVCKFWRCWAARASESPRTELNVSDSKASRVRGNGDLCSEDRHSSRFSAKIREPSCEFHLPKLWVAVPTRCESMAQSERANWAKAGCGTWHSQFVAIHALLSELETAINSQFTALRLSLLPRNFNIHNVERQQSLQQSK